jgi:hypothetical protein
MDARVSPFFLTREASIFCVYNASMRGRVTSDVQRWADYSFLLQAALEKLPNIECDVYRGLDQPLTQVSHEFKEGALVWLPSVTSTTTARDTALVSFGTSGSSRPGTLLKIHVIFAKDIKAFSVFPSESELLLSPNTCIKIELALASEKVAKMAGMVLGTHAKLPENVDLIVATQQPVTMDTIMAAIIKDDEDLVLFTQSQYHVVPPQAATSSSLFAPVVSGSPTVKSSSSTCAAAIAWCAGTRRRLSVILELEQSQRIVSRDGDARYVSNDAAPSCTICKKVFGIFLRRHHCLVCGIVACDSCSKDKKRGCMKCEQWSGTCKCQTPRLERLRMCLNCNWCGGVSAATSKFLASEESESACILAAEHTLASHGLGSDIRSLLTAGCSLLDLQGAGADTSLSSLKAAGCDALILKEAGFTAKTLLDDGALMVSLPFGY